MRERRSMLHKATHFGDERENAERNVLRQVNETLDVATSAARDECDRAVIVPSFPERDFHKEDSGQRASWK